MNLGRFGEKCAADYLINKGYKIIKQNFHTRRGEIDIVATIWRIIVFVEVKTRIGVMSGYPHEAINPHKLIKVSNAAKIYVHLHHINDADMRIDVVSIVLSTDLRIITIDHFVNVIM